MQSSRATPFTNSWLLTLRPARLWPAALALYLLARLPNLLALPIFNDEANYQLRGLIIAENYPYSLHVGKIVQDGLLALLMRLPGDPLLLARLCSALFGMGTLLAILAIGRALGRPGAGLLAGLLYAAAPLAVVHERLGIPDSLLTLITTLVLLAGVSLAAVERPSYRHGLAIGALVALASLVKLNGVFVAAFPLLAVLALPASPAERRRRLGALAWGALPLLLWVGFVLLSGYGLYEQRKAAFDGLGGRLASLALNVAMLTEMLLVYLPAPAALGLLALLRRDLAPAARRAIGMLLGAALCFTLTMLAVGTEIYPRYLMPAWPPLLLACALGASELWRLGRRLRPLGLAAVAVSLAYGAFFAARLIAAPHSAPLITMDRMQYVAGYPSGYFASGLIELLEGEAAAQGAITVATVEAPRLIYSLPQVRFYADPRVTVAPVGLGADDAPARLAELAARRPTYIVLYEPEYERYRIAERLPSARRLATITNPHGPATLLVLRYEPAR